MGALGLLFSTYWKPLLALGLCLFILWYIGHQRDEINGLERDNASLQATIDLTKAIGQAANEKAARIEQGAQQAVSLQAQQGQSDINKIKAYYEAHPLIKRVSNSVCQPAPNSGSRQLPDIPTPAEESTTSGQDADTTAGRSSVEESCAITTVQYNTLHEAWDKACVEFGCK